jgi:hypothetical protein
MESNIYHVCNPLSLAGELNWVHHLLHFASSGWGGIPNIWDKKWILYQMN